MSLSASNDSSYLSKADHIAHKFFTKVALLVHNARATPLQAQPKFDKWFNIETPDTDQYRDQLRLYRTLSSATHGVPPFEVQVLLCVPELATNQVLVLSDASATRTRVDPTPSHVLLESWVVVFKPGREHDDDRDVALAGWKLSRKLRRPDASGLAVQVRVADRATDDRVLKFGAPLSSSVSTTLPTSSHAFAPVTHPFGTLTVSTTYLPSPLFQIDTLESLLSSRFLSQDDESFTPTLALRQQTPPMRSSLPRSTTGPSPSPSIADRFVLPANPVPAPHSGSLRSRPTSLISSSNEVVLPTAGALPIRRPSINTIHPFKSSTLSSTPHSHSSSSLRQQSPLLPTGPSLPSRPSLPPMSSSPSTRVPVPSTSSSSPRPPAYPPLPASPFPSSRPSPPFVASRPSPPTLLPPSTGRRYSSSFGHRYTESGGSASASASGGAGSGSSGGSGGRRDGGERVEGASFLSATTDDDDISAFVQAIDARAPLGNRSRAREPSDHTVGAGGSPAHDDDSPWLRNEDDSSRIRGAGGVEANNNVVDDSPRIVPRHMGAIWEARESESEANHPQGSAAPRQAYSIDAELKRMNDEFAQSLAGLEGRPRRRVSSGFGRRVDLPPNSPIAPTHPRSPRSPANLTPGLPESPSSAGHTRLPTSSPLRTTYAFDSPSDSDVAPHRRTGSGSDEVIGRLDFDDSTIDGTHYR
ncbi:autophagy-related protein 13-domain-containing protein [Hysterangium stoloniferum]|nr:autophagy-related protein 13-domain-containing protein [Hysterangium stoloniferum]